MAFIALSEKSVGINIFLMKMVLILILNLVNTRKKNYDKYQKVANHVKNKSEKVFTFLALLRVP